LITTTLLCSKEFQIRNILLPDRHLIAFRRKSEFAETPSSTEAGILWPAFSEEIACREHDRQVDSDSYRHSFQYCRILSEQLRVTLLGSQIRSQSSVRQIITQTLTVSLWFEC
jgi:hypothetical protein